MKAHSRHSSAQKKQLNPQQSLDNPLQIILSSIQTKGINTKSLQDQILEFLTHLNAGQKVFMLPSTNKSEYLQIFNIRNNEAVMRHRIGRKREVNKKKQAKEKEKQRDKEMKIMFVVEASLCTNCILLSMMDRKNEKIDFNLGCRVQDWKRQILASQAFKEIQEQRKNIVVYQNIQSLLKNGQQSNEGREYRKKNGKSSKCRNSMFGHLKQIKIEVNNEQVSLQEWASCLNVGAEILELIQGQSMNNLQTFQFVIRDNRRFRQQLEESAWLQGKVSRICRSIKSIIQAKNDNNYQSTGYFPHLVKVAFNPMLYLMVQNIIPPLLRNLPANTDDCQQNDDSAMPLTKLSLIDVTDEINNPEYLHRFLKIILYNFPKLTDLSLQMAPNTLFDLFNEFASELYKYCCLLQTLHIIDNNPKIDKIPGLRSILQNFPYLSDLRIKIFPRGDESMNRQFEKQWLFIKQIQFRRLHIQRLINMIKILQKKGYSRSQCMEIIEFMKPLKFPTITS